MTDNLKTDTDTDNLNDKNAQTLSYITQLQQEEMSLYASLDKQDLSEEQKQSIISKINELSQMRLNLYGNIKDLLDTYKQNASESNDVLQQQIIAVKIMENELENAKTTLSNIDNDKATKVRLAAINTYYGKQYGAHTKLMKTIIIFCIPLIILAVLYNWGLLPSLVYKFLLGIVFLIAAVVIGYQWLDMSRRDNMNWDEYDWAFNPNTAQVSTTSTTDSSGNNPWPEFNMTCIGAECCTDGTTFDENLKKCVSVEGFETIEKYSKMPLKSEGFNVNFIPRKALLRKF
jgi:hypothetical protein